MMKNIFRALLLFVSCLMLACTDLDELISGDDVHSAILRFEGSIEGYDVKTRATTSVWPDGARIYIQYQTANGVTNGSAVYSSKSDTWTVTYSGTLTQGKAMSCSVYYFENPSSMTATYAILNAHSASYADAEASYFFEDGTITIQGVLKPLLGRIRFKGTAGTSFTLSGLKWYTGYSNASNSLSQQSGTLSLTVGSNGYTPYVYAQFADASARKLTLVNGEDEFTKTFSSNVLAASRSGYVNIPTASSKEGWTGGTDGELFGLCPDNNHPHAIDLGLGVKFACCNVGADSPIGYGDYYAWGETAPKNNYEWGTYKWCNGSSTTMTKYCNDPSHGIVDNIFSLDFEDDPARANWRGLWRMPTTDDIQELCDSCSWIWTTINNVKGCKVTASNGNSIFLPANGYFNRTTLTGEGSYGYYWSLKKSWTANDAYFLSIQSSKHNTGTYHRCWGLSVRPICVDGMTVTVNGVTFNMIKVEGGTFQMGQEGVATPVHQVTLTNDYYIGETEVTQELWTAVMGSNPSYFTSSDQLPVETVSWDDCQTFISKLNALTGKTFRLPTEAEWEFAARGGNASKGYTYSGSNTLSNVAWNDGNSSSMTHEVAIRSSNELGLYDMSGNINEWCQDWYGDYSSAAQIDPIGLSSGTLRVYRGGSWYDHDYYDLCFRPVYRFGSYMSLRSSSLGLRLAL